MMTSGTSAVGAVFAALVGAHYLGDYWAQTNAQAGTKGRPGWVGIAACVRHVAVYTAVAAGSLGMLAAATGWWPHPVSAAAGLGVSAATHYVADRRRPLIALAKRLGKGAFLASGTVVRRPGGPAEWSGPGTALIDLDQSWHLWWVWVAALVVSI